MTRKLMSCCRLMKKWWVQCLLSFIIVCLLLKIRNTFNVHNPPKKDFTSLLKHRSDAINKVPLSLSTYFDVPHASTKKIDWHDHKFIEYEAKRVGLGEQGEAALLARVDSMLEKAIYHANGYNGYVSDQISLNRSLPDIRHPNCKQKKYLADLPTVSAIVPFWNEHFSTLLRTVQSMLNRAPPHLLLEVILVNDFSDLAFTWTELNDHMLEHLGDRVKVIHLKERMGLMAARTIGARSAKGDVLVFVDAHTEANVNWLPPLIEPIALNYKTVTVPFVDFIDVQTFAYTLYDENGYRGIFDWNFLYHQIPRKPEDIKDPIEPFRSPVMNGGLFAISAKWFWELGGYDEGLDVWGGEQFEISFKLWQCGGEMLDIPCSRFGHVFRLGGKAFKNPREFDFLLINYKRVAEIWMDDYAKYVYMRRYEDFAETDPGDMTKMKAIRKKLQCKSFQWYLENVATEVLTIYPPTFPAFASGSVRSHADKNLCVDTMDGAYKDHQLALDTCVGPKEKPTQHQYFQHTYYREIQGEQDRCLDAASTVDQSPIFFKDCTLKQGGQFWWYDPVEKVIYKDKARQTCMDCDLQTKDIFVHKCDATRMTQKWEWGFVNKTMMADWLANGAIVL